tara:strand:+ start:602 stop:841 length:240 start_codon:yes stop_codon:yes gene_type:complete
MKEFMIVITMFFADPSYSGNDAVELITKNEKPLVFRDMDACHEHVHENLETFKEIGKEVYPEAIAVKQIFCLRRESTKI